MALRTDLVSTSEAFGKQADLSSKIVKVGWSSTPFLSTIANAAPKSRDGLAADGHGWWYDQVADGVLNNAHVEGGPSAGVISRVGAKLSNHYQIVKDSYGVTGSQSDATLVNGELVLTDQFKKSTEAHKKTLEMILISDQAAVARVNTTGAKTPGKCGGLKSFATANNKITVSTQAFDWKLLREMLKIGFMNGCAYTHILMPDTQKDKLDDILFSKTQIASFNASRLENNVTQIGQTAYGNNIQVILSPYLADDEIIAYKNTDIVKVDWRAMKTRPVTKDEDGETREIVSEMTLRVCHPYAFAWVKGLTVS